MARNRYRLLDDPASRFVGVSWSAADGRFAAALTSQGQRIRLGLWRRAEDAAIARDRAVLFLGLDLRLNLPAGSRRKGPASVEALRREARLTRKVERAASRYLGVLWSERRQVFYVSLYVGGGGKRVFVGSNLDSEEAAVARDRAVLGLFDPDATLNFPDRRLKPATLEQLRAEARARSRDGSSTPAGRQTTSRGRREAQFSGRIAAPTSAAGFILSAWRGTASPSSTIRRTRRTRRS